MHNSLYVEAQVIIGKVLQWMGQLGSTWMLRQRSGGERNVAVLLKSLRTNPKALNPLSPRP